MRRLLAGLLIAVPGLLCAAGETVLFVPAVAHARGAAGTFWSTDLTLFNPSASRAVRVAIAFLPAGRDNTQAVESSIDLAPGRALLLAGVVSTLGGEGGGGLRLRGDAGFLATSRTSTPGCEGSLGVSIPALDESRALRAGAVLLGARAGFRVNAGFLNPSASRARVSYTLRGDDGSPLSRGEVDLPPLGFQQLNGLLPEGAGPAALAFEADGPVFAFATLVDGGSGDPAFAMAEPSARDEGGRYLMAFHSCESALADCRDPRNHRVQVATSPDGAAFQPLPGWQAVSGSVPDLVRRGDTIYVYTPGRVTRYRLDTKTQESSVPVAFEGSSALFADPSPARDEDGRLVLFFLYGKVGADPASCRPQEATCQNRIGSATEVAGSDGTLFRIDEGDRAVVELSRDGPGTHRLGPRRLPRRDAPRPLHLARVVDLGLDLGNAARPLQQAGRPLGRHRRRPRRALRRRYGRVLDLRARQRRRGAGRPPPRRSPIAGGDALRGGLAGRGLGCVDGAVSDLPRREPRLRARRALKRTAWWGPRPRRIPFGP